MKVESFFCTFGGKTNKTNTMSVVVKELTKFYGKQCVLDKVSFTLKEGQITGFIGANGAGKTTTMDIITGYQHNWQGSVQIYENDIRTAPLFAKQRIGYLPEHNPLENKLYVKEYLNYVARIYLPAKQRKSAVEKVIQQVGLQKEQHKRIGMLSKGYKQRVGLAQAMVHDPKILILDEPTTGLDPEQLLEIRSLIQEISKDKIVLFSTHIMQEAEALCNRILLLKKGQLIKDFELKQEIPAHQKVRIVFQEPFFLSQLSFAKKIEPISENEYIIFSNEKEDDIRPHLFDFAKDHDLKLIHISLEQENLAHTIREYFSK